MNKTIVWINGVERQHVAFNDRGLAYGDGLFETMRVCDRKIPLWDLHVDRLSQSLLRIGVPADIGNISTEVHEALQSKASGTSGILKLIITRGTGGRGYYTADNLLTNRIISWHAFPSYPKHNWDKGVRLFPCKTRLQQSVDLAGMKHLCRLEQVLARREWSDPDFCEGLMLNQKGLPAEGTMSNLFFVDHSGFLCTPTLKSEGVWGVMRAWIMREENKQFRPVKKRELSLNDMQSASEVFLTNSVNGIWPVYGYKNMLWKVGPVTRRLQQGVTRLFGL